MDPVTVVAIASFAYSVYGSISNKGSGNPLDALVKMLTQINKELKVINEKLSVIYEEIVALPDKSDYKTRTNDLISVSNLMPLLYNNLQSDIERNDGNELKGRLAFKQKSEKDISHYINVIRIHFNVLKTQHDSLTVALLANACQNSYELSRLIDLDEKYIKNEQKEFLKYFREAVWLAEDSLENKIADTKSNIAVAVNDSFIVDWRFRVCTQRGAHEDPAEYNNERYFRLYKPVFEPVVFTSGEMQIRNALLSLGYLDAPEFNNRITAYSAQEIKKLPPGAKPIKISKEVTYENRKDPRDMTPKNFGSPALLRHIEADKQLLNNNSHFLVALSSVHNLAMNTIKHINFRLA